MTNVNFTHILAHQNLLPTQYYNGYHGHVYFICLREFEDVFRAFEREVVGFISSSNPERVYGGETLIDFPSRRSPHTRLVSYFKDREKLIGFTRRNRGIYLPLYELNFIGMTGYNTMPSKLIELLDRANQGDTLVTDFCLISSFDHDKDKHRVVTSDEFTSKFKKRYGRREDGREQLDTLNIFSVIEKRGIENIPQIDPNTLKQIADRVNEYERSRSERKRKN